MKETEKERERARYLADRQARKRASDEDNPNEAAIPDYVMRDFGPSRETHVPARGGE